MVIPSGTRDSTPTVPFVALFIQQQVDHTPSESATQLHDFHDLASICAAKHFLVARHEHESRFEALFFDFRDRCTLKEKSSSLLHFISFMNWVPRKVSGAKSAITWKMIVKRVVKGEYMLISISRTEPRGTSCLSHMAF